MPAFANISIREIDNGFVVSTRGQHLNRIGDLGGSERFYPDFETLTSDGRAIFEAAMNEARAEQSALQERQSAMNAQRGDPMQDAQRAGQAYVGGSVLGSIG